MLSRREWMRRLFLMPATVLVARRAAAETAGKMTKAAAHYRDRPKNGETCAACRFFVPAGGAGRMGQGMMGRGMMGQGMGRGRMVAGTCTLVAGSISPMGWCVLYRPLPN